LAKKERKKAERADEYQAAKAANRPEIEKAERGKDFGDVMSSDDSEDEKPREMNEKEVEEDRMDKQIRFNKRKR
jgi:hypothetical protein